MKSIETIKTMMVRNRKVILVGCGALIIAFIIFVGTIHYIARSHAAKYRSELRSYANAVSVESYASNQPKLQGVWLGGFFSKAYRDAESRRDMLNIYDYQLDGITNTKENATFKKAFDTIADKDGDDRRTVYRNHDTTDIVDESEIPQLAKEMGARWRAFYEQSQKYQRQLMSLNTPVFFKPHVAAILAAEKNKAAKEKTYVESIKTLPSDDPSKYFFLSNHQLHQVSMDQITVNGLGYALDYRIDHPQEQIDALIASIKALPANDTEVGTGGIPEVNAYRQYYSRAAENLIPADFLKDHDSFGRVALIRYLLANLSELLADTNAEQLKTKVADAYETARLYHPPKNSTDEQSILKVTDHIRMMLHYDYYGDTYQIYKKSHAWLQEDIADLPDAEFISEERAAYVKKVREIEKLDKKIGAIGAKYKAKLEAAAKKQYAEDSTLEDYMTYAHLEARVKSEAYPLQARVADELDELDKLRDAMTSTYDGHLDGLNEVFMKNLEALRT